MARRLGSVYGLWLEGSLTKGDTVSAYRILHRHPVRRPRANLSAQRLTAIAIPQLLLNH